MLYPYGIAPTGRVPAWLGSFSNLRSLCLDGNELTGAIPGTLATLSSLEVLDLGENALAGAEAGQEPGLFAA